MAFCCEDLAKEVGSHQAFTAGGMLYPPSMHPTGQIEQDADDGTWSVWGCCGGGCYVLTGVKFCPFCGTRMPGKSLRAESVQPQDSAPSKDNQIAP